MKMSIFNLDEKKGGLTGFENFTSGEAPRILGVATRVDETVRRQELVRTTNFKPLQALVRNYQFRHL